MNSSIGLHCSSVPCQTLSYIKIKILACCLASPRQFKRLQVCFDLGKRKICTVPALLTNVTYTHNIKINDTW